jgi:hypothetical protein
MPIRPTARRSHASSRSRDRSPKPRFEPAPLADIVEPSAITAEPPVVFHISAYCQVGSFISDVSYYVAVPTDDPFLPFIKSHLNDCDNLKTFNQDILTTGKVSDMLERVRNNILLATLLGINTNGELRIWMRRFLDFVPAYNKWNKHRQQDSDGKTFVPDFNYPIYELVIR